MAPLSTLIAVAAALAATILPSPAGAADVTVTRDVGYGTAPLTLDLYTPAASADDAASQAARPAVIWVHGGGWTAGDNRMPSAVGYATELARRGYVTASVDYRLLATGGCPRAPGCQAAMAAAQADVEQAVRWVRAHHAELGVDPRRIALAGSSAGAITSLLVGTQQARGAHVRAVVSLSGGLPPETLVDRRAAPALLLHGTSDDRLSPTWSLRAARVMQSAGALARLRLVPGGEHDLWLAHRAEAVRRMAAFLGEHLAVAPAGVLAPARVRRA